MFSTSADVFIVDDDPSVCSSISRLLRGAGYAVQAYNSTLELALLSERPQKPCCLILDVGLPEISGLDFKAALDRQGIRIPTIFITGIGDIPMGVTAMKSGAFDFLPKPFETSELESAVARALDEDEKLLRQEIVMRNLRRNFETLCAREREVFFAVTSGLLNKQVALRFGITLRTIKAHRARVMEKMGADTFAALVRMADLLHFLSDRADEASDVPVGAYYEDISDLVCHNV